MDRIKNIFYNEVFKEVCPSKGINDRYYGLYIIQNQLDYKFYIGRHCSYNITSDSYFGSGIELKRAIAKYGKENFRMKYFHFSDTAEQLDKDEGEVIDILLDEVFHGDWVEFNKCSYNLRRNGVNSTNDGFDKVKINEDDVENLGVNSCGELILGVNKDDGKVIVFLRINESALYGFDTSQIYKNLSGRSQTAYRFKFTRTDNPEEIRSFQNSNFYDSRSKENYDKFLCYLASKPAEQGRSKRRGPVRRNERQELLIPNKQEFSVELGNGLRNLIDSSIKDNLRIDVIAIDGNTIRVAIKMNDFTFPVGDGSFRIIS